jgi:Kelch motif
MVQSGSMRLFRLFLAGSAIVIGACSGATSTTSGNDGGHDASFNDASSHDAAFTDAADGGPKTHANGTLGAWQSLAAMPIPRANHCAVAANGYLVVIGGNYAADGGFVDTDAVDVAPIGADGSIGTWSQAGTTPSPVSGCTSAASGGTIFLVDGLYEDTSDRGHMFSAELSSSGKLGPWKALGPLPNGQDAFYSNAWVSTDSASTLLAIDSALSRTGILEVATAPKLGTWSEEAWLKGFLGRPEYAFTGNFVYAMGGYLSDDAGNPTESTVYGAAVEPDGKIGTAFETEALPMPITYGEAVAVDDWIFVVGGKASPFGTGEANAFSSQVGSGGMLGPWKPQTSLPQARTDMALTSAGDFIYLTGGGDMAGGLATVFAARVRF